MLPSGRQTRQSAWSATAVHLQQLDMACFPVLGLYYQVRNTDPAQPLRKRQIGIYSQDDLLPLIYSSTAVQQIVICRAPAVSTTLVPTHKKLFNANIKSKRSLCLETERVLKVFT